MDDTTARRRGREFLGAIGDRSTALPVRLEPYLKNVNAALLVDKALPPGESGYTMTLPDGRNRIVVNGTEDERRQRFTVCHEVAHIALGLPTEHSMPGWQISRRPHNEMLCDAFAAEILLPVDLFRPLTVNVDPSLQAIEDISRQAGVSFRATAGRFVELSRWACAFVVAEAGTLRCFIPSPPLRALGAWAELNSPLPAESIARRRRGGISAPSDSVDAGVWFRGFDGAEVVEDALHLAKRDQTYALLWLTEDDVVERQRRRREPREEDTGLPELDGKLPWPRR